MKDVNVVALSGRVASDMGMIIYQTGVRITLFQLAATGRFPDEFGDSQDIHILATVETRMELAQFCEYYLEVGDAIIVTGSPEDG